MKNIKKISILMASLLLATGLAGCSPMTTENSSDSKDQAKSTMNIAVLKGPSAMGMATLMDQDEKNETKVDYNFQILGAPDEIIGKISTGEIDVAAVPSNLGATLNVKTEGNVKMLAVETLGTLYILERGNSIKSISDLSGKTIVSAGQGSTPEYLLNHLLAESGLKDSVKVEFVAEHTEAASKLLAGEADVIMVPEPFVTQITSKSPETKIALDLTKEWNTITKTELPMTAIIGRADYITENKEAIEIFRSEAGQAVDQLQSDHKIAAKLIEKFGIMPAPIAEKALPNCNIVFITGSQIIQPMQAYFEILFKSNPKSIGGKMPAEDFYYVG
ncbi:MAG: ABC transporter substrate-binding protein [Filifactoraceae bacterium]